MEVGRTTESERGLVVSVHAGKETMSSLHWFIGGRNYFVTSVGRSRRKLRCPFGVKLVPLTDVCTKGLGYAMENDELAATELFLVLFLSMRVRCRSTPSSLAVDLAFEQWAKFYTVFFFFFLG